MPLSIKDATTEQLAREVAKRAGESLTEAIQTALRERLERLQRDRKQHILRGQLEEILRRVDSLPELDSRSADEIIGYDENGLPR